MQNESNLDTSIKMELVGLNGIFRATVKGKSITECLGMALKLDHIVEPILVAKLLSSAKLICGIDTEVTVNMVYFSSHDARLLVDGKIKENQYLELYFCESLCRNTQELYDENSGFDIDTGSLFLKNEEQMTLIDRDCTFYTTYKEYAFEILNF